VCFSSISPFLYKKFHAAGVTGVTTKRSRHADFRLHKTIDSLGRPQQGRFTKTMQSLLMPPVKHVLKVSACCWLPMKWQRSITSSTPKIVSMTTEVGYRDIVVDAARAEHPFAELRRHQQPGNAATDDRDSYNDSYNLSHENIQRVMN
jgi:hypothetical protein